MSDIISDKNTFTFPICDNCKNHLKGIKCKAFDIIPDRILLGKNDHSKPLPEQENDIVFEEKTNK